MTAETLSIIFYNENQFIGLPCCTRGDLSIDLPITTVGLILTKLWCSLFSGYGQTDKISEYV